MYAVRRALLCTCVVLRRGLAARFKSFYNIPRTFSSLSLYEQLFREGLFLVTPRPGSMERSVHAEDGTCYDGLHLHMNILNI